MPMPTLDVIVDNFEALKMMLGWGCSSMLEPILSMHEAQDLSPNTHKEKRC